MSSNSTRTTHGPLHVPVLRSTSQVRDGNGDIIATYAICEPHMQQQNHHRRQEVTFPAISFGILVINRK